MRNKETIGVKIEEEYVLNWKKSILEEVEEEKTLTATRT